MNLLFFTNSAALYEVLKLLYGSFTDDLQCSASRSPTQRRVLLASPPTTNCRVNLPPSEAI